MIKYIQKLFGPFNQYTYFVGPNPKTSINKSICPTIHSSVFVSPFSSIIGDVYINQNVFIACNVVLRADEGSPFYISCNTNIQDGVIFHGLAKQYVTVKNKKYSIYVGDNISCAHGCVIHGPCFIGDNCFVGVRSVIFDAFIKEGCFIGTGAIVTNGVLVDANRYIPAGAIIDTQYKADLLGHIPHDKQEFSKKVIDVNTEFPNSYSLMFGDNRCSCGLSCKKR